MLTCSIAVHQQENIYNIGRLSVSLLDAIICAALSGTVISCVRGLADAESHTWVLGLELHVGVHG